MQYRATFIKALFLLLIVCISSTSYTQNKLDTTKAQMLLYKDSADWQIGLMLLNTSEHEFAPTIFNRGLFFCTNAAFIGHGRHDIRWDGKLGYTHVLYIPNVYKMPTIELIKKQYSPLSKANYYLKEFHKNFFRKTLKDFSVNYHYGPLCFSADGKKVFFTRTQQTSAIMYEICEADINEEGKFENVRKLPFNSKYYNCYHPAITKDGNKLYFVSDKLGGMGKADIYYVDRFGDTWSQLPLNVGAPINTPGNEMFPFIFNDTLYYSSDAMPDGLGGMDIYEVNLKQRIGRVPKNIGYPINSAFNDFGIFKSTTDGNYFSSNRNGNDDIYKLEYHTIFYPLKGIIVDSKNREGLANIIVSQYLVDDGIAAIRMDSLRTGASGHYAFTVKPNHTYQFIAKGKNITTASYTINTDRLASEINKGEWAFDVAIDSSLYFAKKAKEDREDSLLKIQALQNKAVAKEGANNYDSLHKTNPYLTFYFNYNSAQILSSGFTALNELAQKLLSYQDQNISVIISGYTDNAGSKEFNIQLSKKRAEVIAAYLKTKGVPDSLLKVQYFGKEMPIMREGHIVTWMSRRAEIYLSKPFKRNIYKYAFKKKPAVVQSYTDTAFSYVNNDSTLYTILFDYNSDELNTTAFLILDKLVSQTLKDSSKFTSITFIGYSDSTEKISKNLILAKKRVDVVIAYLQSRNLNVTQPKVAYKDREVPTNKDGTIISWMNRKVEIVIKRINK